LHSLVEEFEGGIGEISECTFIINHGLGLSSIAKHPEKRDREIGDDVGITERTAHKIIIDLESEGYITKVKIGRQNKYRNHPDMPIKDEMSSDVAVGELLTTLGGKRRTRRTQTDMPENAD